MRKALACMCSAAVAVVAGPALPAAAGSDTTRGAEVAHWTRCDDFGTYSVCFTAQDEYAFFRTPSGTTVFDDNTRETWVFTYSGGTSTTVISTHHQSAVKEDLTGEFSTHERYRVTAPDGSVCTTEYDLVFASGQVRYENTTTRCAPSA